MGEIIQFPSEKITYVGPTEDINNISIDSNNIIHLQFQKEVINASFDEHVRYVISIVMNGLQGTSCPCHMLITKDDSIDHTQTHYWQTCTFEVVKDNITNTNYHFVIEEYHLKKAQKYFLDTTGVYFNWTPKVFTLKDNTEIKGYIFEIKSLYTEDQIALAYGKDTYKGLIDKPFDIYQPSGEVD